jgi:predicted glycosyl hydrolase (DUF1957 family)
MDVRYAAALVLNMHLPYVGGDSIPPRRPSYFRAGTQCSEPQGGPHGDPQKPENDETETLSVHNNLLPETAEESLFFEAMSETYLPLLEMFDRLEEDHVPFRVSISISPLLGQMLADDHLMDKYAAYLDHQIEFGKQELERLKDREEMYLIAKRYYDQNIDRRAALAARYEGSILKTINHYRQKGRI